MRGLFIFLLGVSLSAAVIVLSSKPVFADHQQDVLGVEAAPVLSIPPTAEGPGIILPDSPLFFLDQLKQEFRLLLVFTPEQKAEMHNAIAGERLAELRIVLVRNNLAGIRIDLQGISDNLKAASEDLTDAKLTGRNIALLAEKINNSIKEKQKALSILEGQATGELQAQIIASEEALKIAKVEAEKNLQADILINETINDLNQQIGDSVDRANLSVAEINRALNVLTKLKSQINQGKQLLRREDLTQISDIKNLADKFQSISVSLQKEIPVTVSATSTKK